MSQYIPLKVMLASLITAGGVDLPQPMVTTALPPSTDYVVAGLSFQFPTRASRWRFGAFARGCDQGVSSAYLSGASSRTHRTDNTLAFQALQTTLTPITPPIQGSNENQDTPVDHTLAAYPTIFLRMPTLSSGTVDFTVQNEAGTEQLYETTFELTAQEEGIVGIQIPPTALPLEVGQTYAWQVMVTSSCPQSDHNFRLHTGSWIERVSGDEPMTAIEQVDMRDRPSVYAEAGLWIDTVSTLAQLRLQDPNDADLNDSWASLMESVNLPEFATEPILHIYGNEQVSGLGH